MSIFVGRSLAMSVLGIYALSPIVGLTFLARAAMIAGFAKGVATPAKTGFDRWGENYTGIHTRGPCEKYKKGAFRRGYKRFERKYVQSA